MAYDYSNRLSTLADGSSTVQATYSYDTLDRQTGVSLANGTSVGNGYDLLNRVATVGNTLTGTTTRNFGYSYDDASRVTPRPNRAVRSAAAIGASAGLELIQGDFAIQTRQVGRSRLFYSEPIERHRGTANLPVANSQHLLVSPKATFRDFEEIGAK